MGVALYGIVFLGGILTILGPCILPIVPIVFARSDRSLRSEGLPMLAGLAGVFALVATVATASATWIAQANVLGRWAALVVLAGLGATLVFSRLASLATRPLVWLGSRLDVQRAVQGRRTRAFVVGAALGLLWAPCAGPILGLVVATAVASGGGWSSATLFLAYALGAATSLSMVLTAGNRVLGWIRRGHRAGRWISPTLGAITLASAVIIALGWDRSLYAASADPASRLERALLTRFIATDTASRSGGVAIGASLDAFAARRKAVALHDEGEMPELAGAVAWINSTPLTRDSLRGKVVMIDFWTYGCYNCLNALPHVKALYAKYKDRGFVVIGVHTPEFAHEKILDNVRREITRLGVQYPVPVDNDYRIWSAFNNQYWPAAYFVDRRGHVRYHHFGEGRYEEQDAAVAELLEESAPDD